MAEELWSGEKTEPATPRKRQESREKGQVARSTDMNTAVLLLAAFSLIYLLAERVVAGLSGLELRILDTLSGGRVTFENVVTFGSAGIGVLLRLMLPLVLSLLAIGLATNLLQVGFLITLKPIQPDLGRINPLKGFGRIFSRRGLMRLLFGLLKLVVVGVVLVDGFRDLIDPAGERSLLGLLHVGLWEAVSASNSALFGLGARAALALLVLALIDFAFQRWQHSRDLMMTKEEVREELKRMEGDPKLKERRRRIQQRLALQRMMADVPKADVVITNPIHVACAVRYREEEMRAPRLLAKGKEHLAHRIRELAVATDADVVFVEIG
ncbi:MAG: flagellar biosynthesis protein FlhB, partial [Planctomycetota bacterium]